MAELLQHPPGRSGQRVAQGAGTGLPSVPPLRASVQKEGGRLLSWKPPAKQEQSVYKKPFRGILRPSVGRKWTELGP